jgi:GGDEF domain-containing protein
MVQPATRARRREELPISSSVLAGIYWPRCYREIMRRRFTLGSTQPQVILARIQENIEALRQSSLPYQISFSTGIVQCDPSSDLTLSDYLALADKQMYEQKKGR